MDRKKSCNCIRQCPCYPRCDEMMDEGQIPGAIPPSWLRSSEPPRQMQNMSQAYSVRGSESAPQTMIRADMTSAPQSDSRMGTAPAQQPGMRMDTMPAQQPDSRMGTAPAPQPEMRGIPAPAPEDDALLMEENERDWQKLKEMYPEIARIIMAEVERVCDSMEYEGSMMFDSMPDRVRIRMLTDDIYDKVKDRYPVEETIDQDDIFVMNQESRRRYPPRQNWLGDFIQVLLFQEMYHRRCRHRGCRRW